jgi:hypothetical protein
MLTMHPEERRNVVRLLGELRLETSSGAAGGRERQPVDRSRRRDRLSLRCDCSVGSGPSRRAIS